MGVGCEVNYGNLAEGSGSGKAILHETLGRVTVDLIWTLWVRFPPRSEEIFLYPVWFPDSLY